MSYPINPFLSWFKYGASAVVALLSIINTQAGDSDPSGLWKWTVPGRNGGSERIFNLRIKAEGSQLTGILITPNRTNDTFTETKISDGVYGSGEISFNVARPGRYATNVFVTKYRGKFNGDTIVGKIESSGRGAASTPVDWKAERNVTGKLVSGPIIEIKPGYDENGNKTVNETHYKEVSVADAEKFLTEHPDAIILDTRSPEEFAAGHLPNAKNYDLTDAAKYKDVLAPLDKSKWYVVHSATGHYRTVRALEYFESKGFEHAIAIDGGYNAWADAGKPTAK